MRHAVSIDRFLPTGSTVENVVGVNLTTVVSGLGRVLLRSLQVIGFAVLSTFGAWPALIFLIYMAMGS